MAVKKVDIETFFELVEHHPVIDARSPGEYEHASIPGAYSLPLFDNEERAVVGTAYKQQSKQQAIKIGLDFFGKKMVGMVEEVEKIVDDRCKMTDERRETPVPTTTNRKTIFVHCWRGGMRSAGVAWLLDLYGFDVYTIVGGYKAFRKWVLQQFEKKYHLNILGGYTGSGKTEVLKELRKLGEKVIDLEGLANHKGSAFGNIGMPLQPSQEMFENKLAIELWKNSKESERSDVKSENNELQTANRPLQIAFWLEDESQRIGSVNIPIPLWNQLRSMPVYFLDIPFEERLEYIVKDYGKGDKEKLINAIVRIKKRLGPLETKTAVNFLLEDELKESFSVLLKYYDKYYTKGLQSRENWQQLVINIESGKVDASTNAAKILEIKRQTK
jgi:tRNA 2-selenouridine synthase